MIKARTAGTVVGTVVGICNHSTGDQRQEDPRSSLASLPSQWVSFRVTERPSNVNVINVDL